MVIFHGNGIYINGKIGVCMRLISFAIIALILCSFSCSTSGNNKTSNAESNYELTPEGNTIITGRIQIGNVGGGHHPSRNFVILEDEYGTQYFVYPRETGNELSRYQGCLIRFIIIFPDEPKIQNGLRTVTPIEWEVLEGTPRTPRIPGETPFIINDRSNFP